MPTSNRNMLLGLLLAVLAGSYPAAHITEAVADTTAPAMLAPQPGQAEVDEAVAYVLTHYHYSREPLDSALSAKIFDQYLKELDPDRSFLLQSDVQALSGYRDTLAESIHKRDLKPAFAIYALFRQRFDERMAYAIALLDKQPDLKREESLRVDDSVAAWAADSRALDELWRKRVKNDVIDLMLDGKTWPEVSRQLKQRYQTALEGEDKLGSDDVFGNFMNAYAKALDPHTEYFAPEDYAQFKTQMSLKLEGIGVELQADGDYVKVVRVLPGGPAAKSGLLHAGDHIAQVAQGDDGAFTDVTGWRLDDVVHLTRGAKGTVLRLGILSAGAHSSQPRTIRLVRDAIKLADRAARSEVITLPRDKGEARIGVIRIPEFYSDFDARAAGDADYNSVARDVKKLLADLIAQHVQGIVIDIRNNGGGSLQEAADLAGLFIPRGPMVQLRGSDDRISVVRSTTTPVYDGPLAVLVDRLSASASEIFAAAIQDYRRGVVIGNNTYGKGVATQFVDLGDLVPDQDKAGQLMFVTDKFYRVTGASTQDRGVTPDILLPSLIDPKQFGEETEDNALPWDTIGAVPYTPVDAGVAMALPELRRLHDSRAKTDPLYQLYVADIAHVRGEDSATQLSLVLDERRRQEQREQAWHTSDEVAWRRAGVNLPDAGDSGDTPSAADDVALRESANIVADLGDLHHG